MGIEIIGKLTQKNNGDFKLVDLADVDYDGTGKSAKQELEKKIEEAKNSSTPYDDTAIKADIQNLKTNQVNLVEDETSMEGIKDNEYPTLTTTDKTLIGSINEVNAQCKDIANEKTIINLNSFNGDTITEKFKNAIKYGGDYSIFFTGIIEINDTINVPDNTRLNLIGNPDGRKNKSIIKFTSLNDKPMFLGENFQEGKNPTDKLYINMKNVTIQTNKNNGKSKNTVFKG